MGSLQVGGGRPIGRGMSGPCLVTDPAAIARSLCHAAGSRALAEIQLSNCVARGRLEVGPDGLSFVPAWPAHAPTAWTAATIAWSTDAGRLQFPTRVLPNCASAAWPIQWPAGMQRSDRRSSPRFCVFGRHFELRVENWLDRPVFEIYDVSRSGIALYLTRDRPVLCAGHALEGTLSAPGGGRVAMRLQVQYTVPVPDSGYVRVGASIVHIDAVNQARLDLILDPMSGAVEEADAPG